MNKQESNNDKNFESIQKFDDLEKDFWLEHAKGRAMINLGEDSIIAYGKTFEILDEILTLVKEVDDLIISNILSDKLDKLIKEYQFKTLN